MGAAGRALEGRALVDRLLTRRQIAIEDEEVVARVALRRILAQLPLGDERVRAVDDDELVEITPLNIRLRKIELKEVDRTRTSRKSKKAE